MRIQNKSVIVTGAGSGIGEGIAVRLAVEGGNVIVNDINAAAAERVAAAIRAAGGKAQAVAADVARSADMARLVAAAVSQFGRLDVMVNNAGWTHRPALEVSEAELGPDNIRVNCINPEFNPDTGLSAEFAGGPLDAARRGKFLATIPLGRFSTALDVANAALYLASDEAAFISGVCIEVDGARCVRAAAHAGKMNPCPSV